jgi:hypothetical protein
LYARNRIPDNFHLLLADAMLAQKPCCGIGAAFSVRKTDSLKAMVHY